MDIIIIVLLVLILASLPGNTSSRGGCYLGPTEGQDGPSRVPTTDDEINTEIGNMSSLREDRLARCFVRAMRRKIFLLDIRRMTDGIPITI